MQKKKGISLIVLVITIIVMIILAASIIVTLSQNGIIGKANEANQNMNEAQIREAAQLAWSEVYLKASKEGKIDEWTDKEWSDKVNDYLTNNGVNTDGFVIKASKNGVTVESGDNNNDSGNETVVPGLYETGSNYTVLKTSWEDLLEDEIIHVENGKLYTNADIMNTINSSSDALDGDLLLPTDGSVTTLGGDQLLGDDLAFALCAKLTNVVVPDSVTSVGCAAFYNCTSLINVTFGENSQLTTIDTSAFEGASNLVALEIPETVTQVADGAFRGCTSLTNMVIPSGETNINDNLFNGCTNLTIVTLSADIVYLGYTPFVGCTNLTTINYGGTVAAWNAMTKKTDPKDEIPNVKVICSDGEVTL